MDETPRLAVNWKKNLVFIGLSQFLAMVGFGCCMPFIPLLLRENLHITDDHIRGVFVSAYYLAGMLSLCVATTVWGMLADRFGSFNSPDRTKGNTGWNGFEKAFAPEDIPGCKT